jgi:hypothetical protein
MWVFKVKQIQIQYNLKSLEELVTLEFTSKTLFARFVRKMNHIPPFFTSEASTP